MRRAQIQLDEETYAAVRRRAFHRGCSISAVVRELLAQALGRAENGPPLTVEDFSFIASGRTSQDARRPVSERHDEALADAARPAARRR
jgi:plasmid stability protein